MADLLDEAALHAALADLAGWHGDRSEIRRSVTVRSADQPALLEELERVAREMDHDPELDISGDEVMITMSTHSAGGVTNLDVEYAKRVSALLSEASTEGN
jgi:4a-hydroxytetrahydrobiopterin dehydratase